MSQPTTSIGFSPTTPAAPSGDQNAVPQSDNGQPLQKVSFYPQKATASLRGTVKPDGTTTAVDGSGVISAVQPTGPGNEVLATPNGSSGTASLRALVAADIPSLPESKITNLTTDLAAKVPTSRSIATTAPLTGGGDLSADRTLAINAFTGDAGSGGAAGAVPAPPAGSAAAGKFLKADGTWATSGGFTAGTDLASIDATHQKVIGLNTVPLDTSVTLVDGMTWQYNASSGKWLPVFDRSMNPVSAVAGKPSAGQLVMIWTAQATTIFPANFASPDSVASLGANPTATAIYSIYKNGSAVGTVTVSTSGVFTFATTGGVQVILNKGDRMTMTAPASQDVTLADVGITLVGTRGAVSSTVTTPPVQTWRGAYSGGTAYSPYDEVSYSGSSYVCKLVTTGNLPTNTTYWDLLAAAGTNGTNGQMLYVDAQNQTQTYCVDTSGSANTVTIAPATAATSYVAGQRWSIKIANSVTGATVVNVSGLGNKNVKKWSSGALAALVVGDWTAGQIIDLEYDGTQFVTMGAGASAAASNIFPWTIVQEDQFATTSAGTSITVTFPHTTAASGNTAFILISFGGNVTPTFPAGWTVDFNVVGGADARLALLHKTTASDTSATFSSSGADGYSVLFFEIVGSHTLDASSTGSVAGTFSGKIVMPAITASANSVIFCAISTLVSSATFPPSAMPTINPSWRPIAVAPGNFNGERVLTGHISTVAASAGSITPPVITLPSTTSFFGGGGTAYASFSIL